jgi:hypothetical protein
MNNIFESGRNQIRTDISDFVRDRLFQLSYPPSFQKLVQAARLELANGVAIVDF